MPYLSSFFKSSLPLKAKNHHALRSFGGCVLSIRKGLTKKGSTFDNINTIDFALLSNLSH